jgi:hypothetical protein
MSDGPFTLFRSLAALALAVGCAPTDDPTTKPTITSGSAAPSAAEPNGSLYLRSGGAADTTLYSRVSGAWVAIENAGGSVISPNLVAGTLTKAGDATAGAETTTASLTLTDLGGVALTSSRRVMVVAATTEFGPVTIDTSVTFSSATGGSIVSSGNGWAIVDTSAAGVVGFTLTNATDETVYLKLQNAGSDSVSASKACAVMACAPLAVTWAA